MSAPLNGAEIAEAAIERFLGEQNRERLRLYRTYLQATITEVSPLATDLAAHAGLALDEVAQRIPLPRRWPFDDISRAFVMPDGHHWILSGSRAFPKARASARAVSTARLSYVLRDRGAWVQNERQPQHDLVMVPAKGVLEAVASFDGCLLRTEGSRAYLLIPRPLPEAVVLALPGRPLEHVIGHPSTDGRGYVIEDARSGAHTAGTVVAFRIGLLPLKLPWAELLDKQAGLPDLVLIGHALRHSAAETIGPPK